MHAKGGTCTRLMVTRCHVSLQIYGSKDVTTANLNAAVQTGAKYLLGFHEPELSSGANLPVQVCSLAPRCHKGGPWLVGC
jgi:hypothetical protein